MKKIKCCLCGKEFDGWGNNPWPVSKDRDASCCDDCNANLVIPARILMMINKEKKDA